MVLLSSQLLHSVAPDSRWYWPADGECTERFYRHLFMALHPAVQYGMSCIATRTMARVAQCPELCSQSITLPKSLLISDKTWIIMSYLPQRSIRPRQSTNSDIREEYLLSENQIANANIFYPLTSNMNTCCFAVGTNELSADVRFGESHP